MSVVHHRSPNCHGSVYTCRRGRFGGVSCCPLLRHPTRHRSFTSAVRSQDRRRQEVPPGEALKEAVERLVVSPVFRAVPWEAERLQQQQRRREVALLLISESDVCRSVLAAACLRQLLAEAGLEQEVLVHTCGTRSYNVGDCPEPAAAAAAEALGWSLPEGHAARLFDPAADIVSYDLLLVMDKYTAGDVLREVSSFELVNRDTQFSYKVRRLGEFRTGDGSPPLRGSEADELDIDDPLYGNYGGEEEEQAVLRAGRAIREACRGLVAFLQGVRQEETVLKSGGDAADEASRTASVQADEKEEEEERQGQAQSRERPLGPAVRARVRGMGPTAWLAPPMLSARVNLEQLPA